MSRVAIIGAGISGLSCAFRLEKLNYKGTIDLFEKESGPLVAAPHVELITELLHRPIGDTLSYLSNHYGLKIQPAATITNSKNYSRSAIAEFNGFLGYLITRGGVKNSIENQLRTQIQTEIQYAKEINFNDIQEEYDHVVIASGNLEFLPECFKINVASRTILKYVLVQENEKKINANEFEAWLNTKYIPKGHAFKAPFMDGKAMMSVVGSMEANQTDLEDGWERFKEEQIFGKYDILEEYEIKNYIIGKPDRLQVNQVYLTGANAGCNNPFLGFGTFNSIHSGIFAADSIVNGEDYQSKMRYIQDEYDRGLALLNRIHVLGDVGYDLMIKAASTSMGSFFVHTKNLDIMDWISRIINLTYPGRKDQDIDSFELNHTYILSKIADKNEQERHWE